MGVRFECPQGHQLNVKAHLSGKRGICPACGAKFIVPAFSGGRVPEIAESSASISGPVNDVASDAAWYVRPAGGGQFGPVDGDVFQQWVSEGRVAADSWVWRSGWADWKSGREALAASGASLLDSMSIQTSDSGDDLLASAPVAASREAIPAPRPGEALSMARRRRVQMNHRLTLILGVVAVALLVMMAVALSR
jgi:hypothetical protein